MTNFDALREFESLCAQHGPLVPELAAHHYAGHSRQTWNSLRRRKRVKIVTHLGVEYVPVEFLRKRDTRPGKRAFYSLSLARA